LFPIVQKPDWMQNNEICPGSSIQFVIKSNANFISSSLPSSWWTNQQYRRTAVHLPRLINLHPHHTNAIRFRCIHVHGPYWLSMLTVTLCVVARQCAQLNLLARCSLPCPELQIFQQFPTFFRLTNKNLCEAWSSVKSVVLKLVLVRNPFD